MTTTTHDGFTLQFELGLEVSLEILQSLLQEIEGEPTISERHLSAMKRHTRVLRRRFQEYLQARAPEEGHRAEHPELLLLTEELRAFQEELDRFFPGIPTHHPRFTGLCRFLNELTRGFATGELLPPEESFALIE